MPVFHFICSVFRVHLFNIPYSVRSDFTGLVSAALILW
jgi:hypothetical protein